MIGIIGGMGPRAGIDLAVKVIEETIAGGDRDHLDTAVLSLPGRIEDRSAFLRGDAGANPGHVIAHAARMLADLGATVAGIACNTAHAPSILEIVHVELSRSAPKLRLLHMIEETATATSTEWPSLHQVGVLATVSTLRLGLYQDTLRRRGIQVVLPGNPTCEEVDRTMYAIKAQSAPVPDWARETITRAIDELIDGGADAVILGCTELPLAVSASHHRGVPLIDPSRILARRLVAELCPARLRPAPWASDLRGVR